jgi:hypothetical protein
VAEVWVLERQQAAQGRQTTAAVTRDCRKSRRCLLLSVCTAFSIAMVCPSLNTKNTIQRSTRSSVCTVSKYVFKILHPRRSLFVDVQTDRDVI